jgi:hypothetical protein
MRALRGYLLALRRAAGRFSAASVTVDLDCISEAQQTGVRPGIVQNLARKFT